MKSTANEINISAFNRGQTTWLLSVLLRSINLTARFLPLCLVPCLLLGCSKGNNGGSNTATESDSVVDTASNSGDADTATADSDSPLSAGNSTETETETATVETDSPLDDGDSDGVYDHLDNCPAVSNNDQSDSDADAVGDICDNCPGWGNASQADGDGDGVGDACYNKVTGDRDSDGLLLDDNCPTLSNPGQEDGDSDGIGDVCDNCPHKSNPFQEDLDADSTGDHCEDALDVPLGTSVCATGSTDTVRLATNLYVLLDLSSSMTYSLADTDAETDELRWTVVTTALDNVADELAAGFNIGMGTFPARCEKRDPPNRCLDTPSACGPERVPDELLPMQAGRDGAVIRATYTNIDPIGTTPTATALRQVLAKRLFDLPDDPYQSQRTNVVILITDGEPNSHNGVCNSSDDLADTLTAAQELKAAGVRVYVIGLGGVNEEIMESIAVAGGGFNPLDSTHSWIPAQSREMLQEYITAIAGASIGCTLKVASEAEIAPDWDRTSVYVNLTDENSRPLSREEYTLNLENPITVTLSDAACDELQRTGGTGINVGVDIRVTCATSCGAREICDDGVDNDCNGQIDEYCDTVCNCARSKDGCGGDCPVICVASDELCDGKDNNCNGVVDEGCCIPEKEICFDEQDNDCDGLVDEGCVILVE